jgi:hypothetical protein
MFTESHEFNSFTAVTEVNVVFIGAMENEIICEDNLVDVVHINSGG